MSKSYITVPFVLPLSKENSWTDLDGDKRNFFIARCHFLIKSRQVEDRTFIGDIIEAFQAPSGTTVGSKKIIEDQYEEIDFIDSFEKSVVSNETLVEFITEVSNELGTPNLAKVKSGFKNKWSNKFKTEFHSEFRYSKTTSHKRTESYESTYTVNGSSERLVVAPVYKYMALDIYLAYVDFLFINYSKKLFGLRKKRRHSPHWKNGRPQNVLKFNIAVCCIKYWKRLEKSGVILKENEYKQEVDEPSEIVLSDAENLHQYHVELPDLPTLYQLAMAAFPLKWIHRKGDWTMEDLKKLEFEEAKESPWYYTYGPGKDDW